MSRTPTKLDESELFAALERLAAYCPWERVDIWACRAPEGKIEFTAYAAGYKDYSLEGGFGHGPTPTAAVDDFINDYPDRNPDKARTRAIRELRMKIAKLEAQEFTLPPYRPCPQIGAGSPECEPQRTPASEIMVNVESEVV